VSATEPVVVPPRGRNTKLVATVVIVLAFAGGIVIGVVADRAWMFHHPGGPRMIIRAHTDHIVSKLDHELKLTPQQHAEVERIVNMHRERIEAAMDGLHPQIRREIDATNEEIARVLTPEQRPKFEKLKMRMLRRRIPPH
jgi:Spy/CpxP family protein refolding chaperone